MLNVRKYAFALFLIALFSLSVGTVMAQDEAPLDDGASTMVRNVDGEELGSVVFITQGDKVLVIANIDGGLESGFHGIHIHETGSCEDTGDGPFTGAGGHYAPDGENHPDHAGDLPTLLVNNDGTAYLSLTTDRFTVDELLADDGSAVIIHAQADNFANIPDEYLGPDQENLLDSTLASGDSGDRMACGVIEAGNVVMQGQPEAQG